MYLNKITIETILWVYSQEKHKRTFEISLEIDFDAGESAITDNINDTFDYSELEKAIVSFVSDQDYNLIERLNTDILDIALSFDKIKSCRVKTEKRNCTPCSESIAIESYRDRI